MFVSREKLIFMCRIQYNFFIDLRNTSIFTISHVLCACIQNVLIVYSFNCYIKYSYMRNINVLKVKSGKKMVFSVLLNWFRFIFIFGSTRGLMTFQLSNSILQSHHLFTILLTRISCALIIVRQYIIFHFTSGKLQFL